MSKFGDLKNRALMSLGLIIIFIVIILFSEIHFVSFIVALAVCFFGVLAALEFLDLAKAKQVTISKKVLLGGVICEILAFFVYSQYPELAILPLAVFLLFMMFVFLSNFRQIEKSFFRVSITTFGFLYIAIPLGMILPILYLQVFEMQDGRFWIFYLIFVTKLTDIGAYFGGRLFGKRKLASKISPKKTVFGSISGLVFALIGSLIFLIFSKQMAFDFNLVEAIVLGLIMGCFAQIGDLCESLLKRDAKIKNSSKLPALGGILDMVDSLMFNIPILYFYLIG